jgi:hypothetical protein
MNTLPTDQQLIDYSGEHLLHELNMFWQLAQAIPTSEPGKPSFTLSVLLESFAIHLRNLIEFFYYPPKQKYVRAHDFFDKPTDWEQKMTTPVKKALQRANEEVEHLTHGRKNGTPPDKVWDTDELLKAIDTVAREFAARASNKKLHSSVREFFTPEQRDVSVARQARDVLQRRSTDHHLDLQLGAVSFLLSGPNFTTCPYCLRPGSQGFRGRFARLVTKAACMHETLDPTGSSSAPESQNFPTISYRFSSRKGVRMDVAEARKGSSYAKHCILLIPLAAGNGFKKIPLPAPRSNAFTKQLGSVVS